VTSTLVCITDSAKHSRVAASGARSEMTSTWYSAAASMRTPRVTVGSVIGQLIVSPSMGGGSDGIVHGAGGGCSQPTCTAWICTPTTPTASHTLFGTVARSVVCGVVSPVLVLPSAAEPVSAAGSDSLQAPATRHRTHVSAAARSLEVGFDFTGIGARPTAYTALAEPSMHRARRWAMLAAMLVSALGGLAVGAILVGPLPFAVSAAPEAAPAPADDGFDRARGLYQQGEARFATADFIGAIELWTEAFSSVPDSTDAARIKALLIYNIATARERAFEVTGDLTHLRQAKVLMVGYAESIPALFGDTPEAETERGKITERLNVITAQIEAADRKKARDRRDQRPSERADDAPAAERSHAVLLGTGAAALAVGVGGLAMMGAGLAMGSKANDLGDLADDDIDGRRSQFDRGRTGNTLAIAGGVVGGVFAITGAVLVGIGAKRRASAKGNAWAPWIGPRVAGLGVRGRF
jgi:hypothetical protein